MPLEGQVLEAVELLAEGLNPLALVAFGVWHLLKADDVTIRKLMEKGVLPHVWFAQHRHGTCVPAADFQ